MWENGRALVNTHCEAGAPRSAAIWLFRRDYVGLQGFQLIAGACCWPEELIAARSGRNGGFPQLADSGAALYLG